MRYKCSKCGDVFDELNMGHIKSFKCEYGERDIYEDVDCCPSCGSDFFCALDYCELCGNDVYIEDLHDGICEDCLKSITPRECYALAHGCAKQTLEFNDYLASIFSVSDIEEILLQIIERDEKHSTYEYVSSDKEWFADEIYKLRKGRRETNENSKD